MKLLPMRHTPQSCHWSVPTLLMPRPYWLLAWDTPWTCWNDRAIWVLESTDTCANCPLWKPREMAYRQADAIPPHGAVPFDENAEHAQPPSMSAS